jgi:hypothetical protein
MEKNTISENIFIDLGFTPELSEKLMAEVKEIVLYKKFPNIEPLLKLKKSLKLLRTTYQKEVSDMGDRRDWDGTTAASAKVDALDEVIYMIKKTLNDEYGYGSIGGEE